MAEPTDTPLDDKPQSTRPTFRELGLAAIAVCLGIALFQEKRANSPRVPTPGFTAVDELALAATICEEHGLEFVAEQIAGEPQVGRSQALDTKEYVVRSPTPEQLREVVLPQLEAAVVDALTASGCQVAFTSEAAAQDGLMRDLRIGYSYGAAHGHYGAFAWDESQGATKLSVIHYEF